MIHEDELKMKSPEGHLHPDITEAALHVIGDVAIPGEAPYDWAKEEETKVSAEKAERDRAAADPFNPDYVVTVLDSAGSPTSECPAYILWGDEVGTGIDIDRTNLTPKTFDSNNGYLAFVDELGALKVVRNSKNAGKTLLEQGYKPDNLNVPFSNGERPDSAEGNAKLSHMNLLEYARELGITIESKEDTVVPGGMEYVPDIKTYEDELAEYESDVALLRGQIKDIHAGRLVPETKGVTAEDWVSAIEQEIHNKNEIIRKMKRFVSVGAVSHEQEAAMMHDQGRYSVVEQQDGSKVVRFIDAHGRYLEAPYTNEIMSELTAKGYKPKVKVVHDKIVFSPENVAQPRGATRDPLAHLNESAHPRAFVAEPLPDMS